MNPRRLLESRLIRVFLIAVVAIVVTSFSSQAVAIWITQRAVELARADKAVPEVLNTLAGAIAAGAAVGGSLATVTTALIARYGLRETTRNLNVGGSDGESSTR